MKRLHLFALRMLNQAGKGRVRSKIFVVIVAVVSVPLFAIGFSLMRSAESAIHQSVWHDREELARRAAAEIALFLSKPRDILTTTAAILSTVYPSSWKQETALVELTLEQPVILKAASIDTAGQVLAYSELGSRPDEYPAGLMRALFDEYTPFFMSEVRVREDKIPYVTLAVPIKKAGVVTGALVADVNLQGIWDIVDSITLGLTGRAFLAAGNGTILAHPDKKKVLKQERLTPAADDSSGRGWVFAYAPVAGTDWIVGLQQERAEAYFYSRGMAFESWMMIFLGEIIALLGGFYLAGRLARPVEALADRINRMSGGTARPAGKDEFRTVSRSLKTIADELKNARDKERFTSMGEAASWIAHEMKNCLVSIKSFVQIFPQKHKDARFVEAFNRLIPEEIRRWEHMLKELSDFSVSPECKRAPVDLCRVVGVTLQTMEYELKAKKVDVIFTSSQTPVMIQGDEERLRQVFVNLVLNAVQAMEEGGRLTVSIESGQAGRMRACVHVSDTGKGISSADLQKIFDPFFTTGKGGMGLGLAISRRIIEEHGGAIGVQSATGAGATFSVAFPLIEADKGTNGDVRRFTKKEEIGQ